MQFLVHVIVETPDAMSAADVARLRAAESARAAELAAAGVLLRLWRVPDRWANWGLWAAADEKALRDALDALPLRAYMTIQVHPLAEHPNDPAV